MIKRITPSKGFNKREKKRDNPECCSFWLDQDNTQEVSLENMPKNDKNTYEQSCKKNNRSGIQRSLIRNIHNRFVNTLKASLLPSQAYSDPKTFQTQPKAATALTVDTFPCIDPEFAFHGPQTRQSPTRRNQRLFRNVSTMDHTASPSFLPDCVIVDYSPPTSRSNNDGKGFRKMMAGGWSGQLQGNEEFWLRKEVEQYRKEYEGLLQEHTWMRNQKQTNKEHYRMCLEMVQHKKREAKEFEQVRRLEMNELRKQFEKFICCKKDSQK